MRNQIFAHVLYISACILAGLSGNLAGLAIVFVIWAGAVLIASSIEGDSDA